MSGIQQLLLGGSPAGYQIERSLRFNSADSAYLNRTPASAGNRKTWTWSGWVKRSALGATQGLFGAYSAANNTDNLWFGFSSGDLFIISRNSDELRRTTQVFRDVSAWYHIVVALDTTQATANDRVKVYLNGAQITVFTTTNNPTQNDNQGINQAAEHRIGRRPDSTDYFNGYLTEINFIDGQALTPSSFGQSDPNTGVWSPIKYTGTYGTNGFYLDFSNNTSTQSLGWDQQGNITRYATAGTYSYTVPSYSSSLVVEVWGGGGGGGQALLPGTDATNGGQSSFNGTVIANGGNRGVGASSGVGANGTGGTASGGDTNTTGNTGNSTAGASSSTPSPNSGNSAIAGVIGPGGFNGVTGYPVGSGGGGAYWTGGSVPTGGAGGSGGYSKKTYAPGAISGTVTVVVGAGGAAGVGGALNGGAGTAGMVRITVDGATTPSDWYDRNNFSVTAGAGNDSLVDTPTSYGTDTGVGGEVRGNYATWNPLDKDDGITSVTNGNLNVVTNGSNGSIKSTIAFPSGKWYWEVTSDSVNSGGTQAIGIMPQSQPPTNNMSDTGKLGYALDVSNSDRKFENGTATSYGTYTQANGAIYMLAFDQDAGKLWYGINGTWLASGDPAAGTNASSSSIPTTTAYCAAVSDNTVSGTFTVNFGQRAFAYTAPSGFKALCTQNLPTPTIGATSTTQANDYFDVSLYTGTGSSLNITGLQFQPDWVWIKGRSGATDHGLYDAVRGVQKQLESNTTTAETTETTGLTAFNSDGFTVGALAQLNTNTATYVSWNWNAGGSTVTNTSGSISSQVRANATAGFSVVTWTSTGANATIGHGLGVAPKMVIVKGRSAVSQWFTWHTGLTSGAYALILNLTDAQASYPTVFNSTTPTSSVFSVGTSLTASTTAVAYCFAEVAGYSAFGKYTGNGSTDGPFVYTGFRPRWILIKATGSATDWNLFDTAINPYNQPDKLLRPNSAGAEATASSSAYATPDILSNGFKLRSTSGEGNGNGSTYIYAAFAENPFKYSLAR